MKRIKLYSGFERFWHWTQAVLILFLAFTGFEIHGSYTFFGFREAVRYHNIAAYLLIALTVFAIFWHFTTGEWRQYVPTLRNIRAQLEFYVFGIFRNAPHPTQKTALNKLNPLQRITYFGLKVFLFPLLVASGLLYVFYRYPSRYGIEAINIESLRFIALAHTLGAFLMVAFLIVHLYMISTGETALSNLRAMITGYEEVEQSTTTSTLEGQQT